MIDQIVECHEKGQPVLVGTDFDREIGEAELHAEAAAESSMRC